MRISQVSPAQVMMSVGESWVTIPVQITHVYWPQNEAINSKIVLPPRWTERKWDGQENQQHPACVCVRGTRLTNGCNFLRWTIFQCLQLGPWIFSHGGRDRGGGQSRGVKRGAVKTSQEGWSVKRLVNAACYDGGTSGWGKCEREACNLIPRRCRRERMLVIILFQVDRCWILSPMILHSNYRV